MNHFSLLLCAALVFATSDVFPEGCKSEGCICDYAAGHCKSCVPGYFRNSTSQACSRCVHEFGGCLTCEESTCTKCQAGTVLKTSGKHKGHCARCTHHTQNCDTCKWSEEGHTICTKCQGGFHLDKNNQCVAGCDSSCKPGKCGIRVDECTACNDGYFVNEKNSTCDPCKPECKTCNNADSCDICEEGYWGGNGGQCDACEEWRGCKSCKSNGCTDCWTGSFLIDHVCQQCAVHITGCMDCYLQDGGQNPAYDLSCGQCEDGMYLTPSDSMMRKCASCTDRMDGCTKCSMSWNGIFKCLECDPDETSCHSTNIEERLSTNQEEEELQEGPCNHMIESCYECSDGWQFEPCSEEGQGSGCSMEDCPPPGESDLSKLSCDVVDGVCKLVIGTAGKITSKSVCVADDALIAGACETMGIGPDDPLSDICAVTLAAAFQEACSEAISEAGKFTTSMCEELAGCSSLDLVAPTKQLKWSDAISN